MLTLMKALPMAARRHLDLPALLQQAEHRIGCFRLRLGEWFGQIVLEINRSQVTRSRQGQRFRGESAWRATGLQVVVAALLQFLEPAVIADWLQGTNAHLNHRRPLDLLRDGHVAAVMAAVEAERAGSFASSVPGASPFRQSRSGAAFPGTPAPSPASRSLPSTSNQARPPVASTCRIVRRFATCGNPGRPVGEVLQGFRGATLTRARLSGMAGPWHSWRSWCRER